MSFAAKLALRSLRKNPSQSILTILTIALTSGLITGLQLISSAFVRYGKVTGSSIVTSSVTAQTILNVVVLLTTIPMIYSIYRFSARRRTKQLALLSTQGASQKFLRSQLLYEALFLAIPGIAIGMTLGSLGAWIVLDIVLADSFRLVIGPSKPIPSFGIEFVDFFLAFFVSMLSVLLATSRTAKELSHTHPLERTAEQPEEKIRFAKIRGKSPKMLAEAQIKRRKGNYRLLTFTLIASILLLMTTYAFIDGMQRMTESRYGRFGNQPDVVLHYSHFNQNLLAQYGMEPYAGLLEYYTQAQIDQDLQIVEDELVPLSKRYNTTSTHNYFDGSVGIGLDKETWAAYTRSQGYPNASAKDAFILLRSPTGEGSNVDSSNVASSDIGDEDKLVIEDRSYSEDEDEKIHMFEVPISGTVAELPTERNDFQRYLTQETPVFVTTNENLAALAGFNNIVTEVAYFLNDGAYPQFQALKLTSRLVAVGVQDEYARSLVDHAGNLISKVLTYGFTILILLVSVSGLVNALLSSFQVRQPEIGILMSVGMTRRQLRSMFLHEGVQYVWKGVFWGAMLGLLSHFSIWKSLFSKDTMEVPLPWSPPWVPLLLIVLLLVSVILVFSLGATRSISRNRDWVTLIRKEES